MYATWQLNISMDMIKTPKIKVFIKIKIKIQFQVTELCFFFFLTNSILHRFLFGVSTSPSRYLAGYHFAVTVSSYFSLAVTPSLTMGK
jgi:hypothetical protein